MSRVVHFEIPSNHPEQSMVFYNTVFGWQFQQFSPHPYWLATTGNPSQPGINGAIMQKRDPHQPVTSSIEVPDIDKTIAEIEQNGGRIVVPKTALPGVGWLAYFTDPDQNIFGLMQNDTNAR